MPRPLKSFNQRQADAARRDALSTISTTEHLLALILIQLKEMQVHRKIAEHSADLHGAGFSRAQAAAILGTTPASLFVLERRHERAESDPAVAAPVGEPMSPQFASSDLSVPTGKG